MFFSNRCHRKLFHVDSDTKCLEQYPAFPTGWAFIGGYVGNAEPVIELMAGVGYEINERASLIFAYRQLTVDYREKSFLYESVQHGFGLGLDIRF